MHTGRGTDDSEPRHLVVVADDAGVDPARNRGIIEACVSGVVQAVSVLATGTALDDLCARLAALPPDLHPAIGLHLNLTEGQALAGPAHGLTDASGQFGGDKRAFWARGLAGGVDADAVRAEVEAQLACLDCVGLTVSRVDGHQHVHLLPGVREGLAAALDERPAVRWVRLGRPVTGGGDPGFPALPSDRVAPQWRARHDAGDRAAAAWATLADEGARFLLRRRRTTDVFLGLDLIGVLDTESVLLLLRRAARRDARTVELMTHPGDCDGAIDIFSADLARERERDALCDPDLPERLRELGFELAPPADIA